MKLRVLDGVHFWNLKFGIQRFLETRFSCLLGMVRRISLQTARNPHKLAELS